MESIRLTTTLLSDPDDVYDAWLSGPRHSAMTGGPATSEKRKGGAFTAWDGYIKGTHLALEPATRILQTWRTAEFPDGAPDSRLEIRLAKIPRGTRLTLLQSGIPDGQGEMYADGWQVHYFAPMSRYFYAAAQQPKKTAKKTGTRGAKQKAVKATSAAKRRTAKSGAPKAAKSSRKAPKATKSSRKAPKAAKSRTAKTAKAKRASRNAKAR